MAAAPRVLRIFLAFMTLHAKITQALYYYDDIATTESALNDTYYDDVQGYDNQLLLKSIEPSTWTVREQHGISKLQQRCIGDTCFTYDDSYSESLPPPAFDPLWEWDNCIEHADGLLQVNGTDTCDLLVRGVDLHADQLYGGLDGRYQMVGCHLGKPLYKRLNSPPGEDRVLWCNPNLDFSWEFAAGTEPREEELLMYGDIGQVSPINVHAWHLLAIYSSTEAALLPPDDEDLYFIVSNVTISCFDENLEYDYQLYDGDLAADYVEYAYSYDTS